jgi:pSer/pThr/pTyr-binding forkhead associated (FHA) protein
MKKVILDIRNLYESKTIEVEDEISLGRTNASDVILDDSGLSRKNTTFFRDGETLLVVDENSTNGTFLNGEKISGKPVPVLDGDTIKIGSDTTIRVKIKEKEAIRSVEKKEEKSEVSTSEIKKNPKLKIQNPKPNQPPMLLLLAIGSAVFIILGGGLALFIASNIDSGRNSGKMTPTPVQVPNIPVRVIDPLGGEDPDDLDDIIASWEFEEKELDVATVQDVKVTAPDATDDEKLLEVPAALLADRKKKAFEPRTQPTGISPPGLKVPPELRGDGVIKQKAKLAQMLKSVPPYQQPMDFADLAKKRLDKELLEMPMAAQNYYLEVGGSATESPFTAFSFQTRDTPILQGSEKYKSLQSLAAKYGVSLDNPSDRKQIRMRLLRMFNPRARPVLLELAEAYYKKFGRPLRVTSLTRSIDYQISLNRTNANSFPVRGEGSLPPHTSGCAFDLARKHMGVDEQNFVMEELARMERERRLDALIEYGINACFHVFIYHDGIAPNM